MADGFYRSMMRNYVVSLCILMVLIGDIIFLLSFGGKTPLLANLQLAGETLFEVGAIALILETINLKRWAKEEVVTSLTSSPDFLKKLSGDALTQQMKLAAKARFRNDPGVDDAVDWLMTTLRAPSRSRYRVELEPHLEPTPESFDGRHFPLSPTVLNLQARCSYQTAVNRSRGAVPINGDGTIHSFFALVPDETELAGRYRARTLTTDDRMAWIWEMIAPQLEVKLEGQDWMKLEPEIRNVELAESPHHKISLKFDICCSLVLHPGQQAEVSYTHRQLAGTHDAYAWHASARTTDFTFLMRNFDDYTLVPVAGPASRSTIERLDLYRDEIRLVGLILPESTFAFAWSPSGSNGAVSLPRASTVFETPQDGR